MKVNCCAPTVRKEIKLVADLSIGAAFLDSANLVCLRVAYKPANYQTASDTPYKLDLISGYFRAVSQEESYLELLPDAVVECNRK